MWTRKTSLLAGLGLALVPLGVAAKSPAVLLLGTLTLAFLAVNRFLFRGSAEITTDRRVDLQRIYEGDSTGVEVHVRNPGTALLFLEVRDRLPRQLKVEGGGAYDFVALPGGGEDVLHYQVKGPLLGVYEIGPTDLRLEDPFGLYYEERSAEGSRTLWVLPRKELLRKAGLISNLPMPLLGEHQVNRPGDGFDFFALREYVPGDTMRRINWKASARSGKMMVNQMMQTTSAEVTVFVDARAILAAGPEDKSPRVTTARTVASVTDFLFVKKDTPRIVLYTDHVKEIEPQPADRMVPLILETMAQLQPKGDFPFKLAVSAALPTLKPRTPVILVSPLVDDPTIMEGVSTLLANDMILTVLSPRPAGYPGVEDALTEALLAERDHLIQELRGFGAGVIDLEADDSLSAAIEKGRVMLA